MPTSHLKQSFPSPIAGWADGWKALQWETSISGSFFLYLGGSRVVTEKMVDRWKTIPSPVSSRAGVGKGGIGVGIDSSLSSSLYDVVAASTSEFFRKHYCDFHTDPQDMGAPALFQSPSPHLYPPQPLTASKQGSGLLLSQHPLDP